MYLLCQRFIDLDEKISTKFPGKGEGSSQSALAESQPPETAPDLLSAIIPVSQAADGDFNAGEIKGLESLDRQVRIDT